MDPSLLTVVKYNTVKQVEYQWLSISVIQDTLSLGMFIEFVRTMATGLVQYLIVIGYLVSIIIITFCTAYTACVGVSKYYSVLRWSLTRPLNKSQVISWALILFFITIGTTELSCEASVVLTAVICSAVFLVIGCVLGMLIWYSYIKYKKSDESNAVRGQAAAPEYEDVQRVPSARQAIALKENVAYMPTELKT